MTLGGVMSAPLHGRQTRTEVHSNTFDRPQTITKKIKKIDGLPKQTADVVAKSQPYLERAVLKLVALQRQRKVIKAKFFRFLEWQPFWIMAM